MKPPALARKSFKAEDLVTADDTNEEHAKFCHDLVERAAASPTKVRSRRTFIVRRARRPHFVSGIDRRRQLGRGRRRSGTGYVFVNSKDEASIGWIEKKAEGAAVTYDRNSIVGPTSRFQWSEGDPRRGNSDAGEKAWPCQKPPWGA